jgi:hypothetical protein
MGVVAVGMTSWSIWVSLLVPDTFISVPGANGGSCRNDLMIYFGFLLVGSNIFIPVCFLLQVHSVVVVVGWDWSSSETHECLTEQWLIILGTLLRVHWHYAHFVLISSQFFRSCSTVSCASSVFWTSITSCHLHNSCHIFVSVFFFFGCHKSWRVSIMQDTWILRPMSFDASWSLSLTCCLTSLIRHDLIKPWNQLKTCQFKY